MWARPMTKLEYLRELLQGIEFAFEGEPAEKCLPHKQREQYGAALAAIGRFLWKTKSKHAQRFFDLSYALTDLDLGANPPILKASEQRSTPNPTQVEWAKAEVAFALDALIELGETPGAAAKGLLSKYPHIKNLASPKSQHMQRSGSSEKTILEWRKSLSAPSRARRATKEAAEIIFLEGRNKIKSLIDSGRRQELQDLAGRLAEHAARIGVFLLHSNTP